MDPHVLIFPLPLQGPIKCMLKLAELLCLADLHVTFLNTDDSHRRLFRQAGGRTGFEGYRRLHFDTISDGLPEDHPRSADRLGDLVHGLESVTKPLFRDMLAYGWLSSGSERPVTCIIADGALNFTLDVAEELKIPLIHFDSISPCCLWTYLCLPRLIDAGELPFQGDDLDAAIKNVPGMEGFLRRRDLPSFCRGVDLNNPITQLALEEAQKVPRSHGLILNTFQELDSPILSHMQALCPNLYPIGPLHTHLKTKLAPASPPPAASSTTSLWEEDRSCMAWLDAQIPKSVVYVSIGSLAVMTWNQLIEFWHGLVNSGQRFLWVRRPNSVVRGQEGPVPEELVRATEERGCLVGWAPQEDVLAHQAVGLFLTHSGWNSTLESLVEAVPMVCWPYFVDQQVNSRFVSEVWRVGVDMKDTCDRVVIERMIRDVVGMMNGSDEFVESLERLSRVARESVREGGSSFCNLNRLIENIRSLKI